MTKYVLVVGNPIDGLDFFGPFDSADDAGYYAESHRLDYWWVKVLLSV
jgi:hypothetical protein